MCIDKDEMLDPRDRVLTCKRFVHDLSIMVVWGSFSVGVYKYARPGSLSKLIAVFKVACSAIYDTQSAIDALAAADQ